MQRFDELLSGYLEGQLSESELDELSALVREDVTLRKKLASAAEMEGLLLGRFAPAENESGVARTMAALPAEPRDKQTVENVMARIEHKAPLEKSSGNAQQELAAAHRWHIRAAAAAFILAAGAVAFYAWQNNGRPPYNLASLGAIASIQSRSGNVILITEMTDDKQPLPPNYSLTGRDGLETRGDSHVKIAYPDGSTLEMWSSSISRIWLRKSTALDPVNRESSLGKRVTLEVGQIEINAAKQPADKPMIVITVDGETQVVGTRFRCSIIPGGTRVDVFEGRVHLTRRTDLKTVDVSSGQYAILSLKSDMTAKPSDAAPQPERNAQ